MKEPRRKAWPVPNSYAGLYCLMIFSCVMFTLGAIFAFWTVLCPPYRTRKMSVYMFESMVTQHEHLEWLAIGLCGISGIVLFILFVSAAVRWLRNVRFSLSELMALAMLTGAGLWMHQPDSFGLPAITIHIGGIIASLLFVLGALQRISNLSRPWRWVLLAAAILAGSGGGNLQHGLEMGLVSLALIFSFGLWFKVSGRESIAGFRADRQNWSQV
ncbi:MAG: hypothetical protein HY291_17565 [Planctomycetes bacterium]|nr:hypothetical protein [Planctomycetota bacterium]